MADLKGAPGMSSLPSLWVQILSFSCRFWEKFGQIIGWRPHLESSRPLPVWEILNPPLVTAADPRKIEVLASTVFEVSSISSKDDIDSMNQKISKNKKTFKWKKKKFQKVNAKHGNCDMYRPKIKKKNIDSFEHNSTSALFTS